MKKQECKHGHDTLVLGRTSSGNCRACNKAWSTNHPGYSQQYQARKPFECWILRTFNNMHSRVKGVLGKHNRGGWAGLPICTLPEFKAWCIEHRGDWDALQATYLVTESRADAPSINRIVGEYGYSVDNLELLTVSQNSRAGGRTPKNRRAR